MVPVTGRSPILMPLCIVAVRGKENEHAKRKKRVKNTRRRARNLCESCEKECVQ